eukprot:Protomagalhaensia_wolfi_Nauph_80__3909@NODE_3967_length_668_cov_11_255962_g3143_i0_p1_GENE_NODE_3967_length_668_cov_11_255962_g3143_i0NODE_3967_length_668_cov_11_255962_g3143_i0_p1_ORF_typecomplete_len113_score0_86NleF_casp_inhib/PF16809_5/0_21_NODE_3967_length_668_cov_11_255962_g3143_i010348
MTTPSNASESPNDVRRRRIEEKVESIRTNLQNGRDAESRRELIKRLIGFKYLVLVWEILRLLWQSILPNHVPRYYPPDEGGGPGAGRVRRLPRGGGDFSMHMGGCKGGACGR